MARRPGIPVGLITGFLGAGKTTLLNRILQNRQGLRAAVFVNEFGSVDIDGSLIKWRGQVDENLVVTLDTGCICCEVNADLGRQLLRVLRDYKGKLDVVLIETSGVCDPGPVLATLENVDELAAETHLDAVIGVVDGSALDAPSATHEAASRVGLGDTAWAQLSQSDIVLLNKCDLVGGVESEQAVAWQAALEAKLLASSCRAGAASKVPRVLRVEHARVALELVASLPFGGSTADDLVGEQAAKRRRLQEGTEGMTCIPTPVPSILPSHGAHRLRASVRSFVYMAQRPFDPLKFEAWIEGGGPPHSIVRAKGLLWMRGVPSYVVFQLAGARTNPFETVGALPKAPESKIVFIGEAAAVRERDEHAVAQALDQCLCEMH